MDLPRNINFNSFNGIKSICAILITLGHGFNHFTRLRPGIEYLSAVSIFFIISGITMGILYKEKINNFNSMKIYWVKRFARIAPLYYFSLLIMLPIYLFLSFKCGQKCLPHYTKYDPYASLLLSPFFLQTITIIGHSWNVPLWQLSTFAFCWLLFPFVVKLFKNIDYKQFFIMFLISYLLPFCLIIPNRYYNWNPELIGHIIHSSLITRFPQFLIGVLIAFLLLNNNIKGNEKILRIIVDLISIILLIFFIGRLNFPLGHKLKKYVTVIKIHPQFFNIPLYALWIGLLVLKSTVKSITSKFLSLNIWKHIGNISLEIYVLHWPVLYMYGLFKNYTLDINSEIWARYSLDPYDMVGIMGITFSLSQLVYTYIEVPSRKFLVKYFMEKIKKNNNEEINIVIDS